MMFDYSILSANEFEILCSDILTRELGIKLRHFSPGKDGGVDLTESPSNKSVVVQVKHYVKSHFSGLKSSLEKELTKLEQMEPKPEKYYVCTSKDLTGDNIKEIYNLFSDYMDSDENIFTKFELDEFLKKETNQDILRKNFKLWLVADKVLTQLISRDVFIDSEVLLDNLEDDFKYFVQTNMFDKCIDVLERKRKLLICGDPGVGKSITSKMIAFYFVKKGYQIRYTTNGLISDLKKSLQDNKDLKEVIFLDDCLGQYYLKLKQWQDEELIGLMNYINLSENKILILNSRVTVLNEARSLSRKLRQYIEDEKVKIKIINMNEISPREKALIFYNHLLKNKVPIEHYTSVRESKKYVPIVRHANYNPRIIEYVTHKQRYTTIKPEVYSNFILETLNNPREVWSEEFRQGLAVEDRIFMHTIFSLTDTFIDLNILEECFVERIQNEATVDNTTNKFEEIKMRLTHSMARVVDDGKGLKIGVLNPSINDYMQNSLSTNHIEKENIIKAAIYIEQLEKILGDEAEIVILSKLQTGEILEKKSLENKIPLYIVYFIVKERTMDDRYIDYISNGLSTIKGRTVVFNREIKKSNVILSLLRDKELFEFYKIDELLKIKDFRENLVLNLNMEEISDILDELKTLQYEEEQIFDDLVYAYNYKLEEYIIDIELIEILEFESLEPLAEVYFERGHPENEKKYQEEIEKLKKQVSERILEEVYDLLLDKDDDFVKQDLAKVTKEKVDDELESTIEYEIEDVPEPPDDYRERDYEESYNDLDIILDRDIY